MTASTPTNSPHGEADGTLERLDRVFSRDGGPLRYVQDALRANAADVRARIEAGAAIYVCGSLQGMAAASTRRWPKRWATTR